MKNVAISNGAAPKRTAPEATHGKIVIKLFGTDPEQSSVHMSPPPNFSSRGIRDFRRQLIAALDRHFVIYDSRTNM